ncbi:DUF4260 family protein [Sphingobacterium corticibacterium]|uniref:DUF4260 family protein n=1 Tax=Sphingobacterium corticibacterium TaxID=2484746 RepID=UPI0019D0AC30
MDMDRIFGYGLKYLDDFKHTHLGWIISLSLASCFLPLCLLCTFLGMAVRRKFQYQLPSRTR